MKKEEWDNIRNTFTEGKIIEVDEYYNGITRMKLAYTSNSGIHLEWTEEEKRAGIPKFFQGATPDVPLFIAYNKIKSIKQDI